MNSLTAIATNSAMEAWSFILSFLAFIVIALLLFAFAYRFGREALVSLIAGFYVGFALYAVFPYASVLKAMGTTPFMHALSALILYLVFVAISYFIIRKLAGSIYLRLGNGGSAILAILTSGFLIALAYHSFSVTGLYSFTPAIEHYFAPAQYFFWWFIAPLVGIIALAP